MRTPRPVPAHLRTRAFSIAEGRAAGISPRMLQHERFVEVHPRVYRLSDVVLTLPMRIAAARLALPPDALSSHTTRLHELGYDHGEQDTLHFIVARDLHIDLDGIMLHRTVSMPPNDGTGVCAEAVFVQLCSGERLVDLIAIGDWLLFEGRMTTESLLAFVHGSRWRPGAGEALVVLPYLDGRSRSPKESETRAVLGFSGLPAPEVNGDVFADDGTFLGCGDLVYRLWRLLIEYEGRQHALDTTQFGRDIDRYGGFRGVGWEYYQVTQERLAKPRVLVARVHDLLVRRGYDGPAPVFGERWESLFEPVAPSDVRAAVRRPPWR